MSEIKKKEKVLLILYFNRNKIKSRLLFFLETKQKSLKFCNIAFKERSFEMNCSVEDSLYSPAETQNMKSKLYVPGIGKLFEAFLEDFKEWILYRKYLLKEAMSL